MDKKNKKKVALIVAHPDDETLWAGGTILSHPSWNWFILCLCRRSDLERAPKFFQALQILNAKGIMGDLDDGPDQIPLDKIEMQQTILKLLPAMHFDLIISHNPHGEYTRHIRHEETGKAVIDLWYAGKISASELWTFAYEDGNKKYYPRPIKSADIIYSLSEEVWQKKYNLIIKNYGFDKASFEAETTPKEESFWQYTNSNASENKPYQFENKLI